MTNYLGTSGKNARGNEQTLQKISAHKLAEEALWKTAKRFQALIEHSSEIIIILDPDGLIRYSSPSAGRILEYASEDLVGKSIFEFTHPDDTSTIADTIQKALQHTTACLPEIEYRLRHRDGSWHTFAATITNLLNEPTVDGLLVNCHDITERKQLEEQFRQVQKMEAIGRLAGGVAHDFNNLLTVIIGNSEFVRDLLDPDDPVRADVERVIKTGHRAASLTRQLLAFSRKQVLQPELLDLNGVISNMGKMLRRLIGEDVDLITVPEMELGKVKADPGQVEQVIMNLAINARDAMPQGGIVTIETANVDLDQTYVRQHFGSKPGSYVMLAVSDTGQGMDEDTRAQIFEPFFTTKEQGTGLGLATVHGIINQSGGHIWVYSEPGHGTSFKVYFPRIEESIQPTSRKQTPGEPLRGSETILLVEDDDTVRELAHRVLLKYGYTVLESRHGTEALQVLEQYNGTIDLLVTDLVMPGGMNGLQLAERLLSRHSKIQVLYMSGYTDNALVNQGIMDPKTAFLEKPFTQNSLLRKVRGVLDGT